MKKLLVTFSLLTILSSAVYAETKIGVVDLQKIVKASSEVKSLNNLQETKAKELAALIKKAQDDVNKQTDPNKKKSLAESYKKQINEKSQAHAKDYATKLKTVESSINSQIGKKATELGYTIILPASDVIWGGDDITDAVLKVIK